MNAYSIALCALALACAGGANAATVIDFEQFAAPATYPVGQSLTIPSPGSAFAVGNNAQGGLKILGSAEPNNGDPGGAVLFSDSGLGWWGFSFIVHPPPGQNSKRGVFDFLSIDIGDLQNIGQPVELTFLIRRQANGQDVTTRTFVLDSVPGLQTLSFNELNVTYVQWFATSLQPIQIDNITFDNLAAVPAPASWMIMLLGFGLVGAAIRSGRALAGPAEI